MRAPFTDIRVEYTDTPERKTFDLRRDGLREVPLLGWCGYKLARPDLPAHHHAGVIEIHFLERGHLIFEVEGRDYEVRGGDMFVTQPGELHSTGGKPVEPCLLYWVNIHLPKARRPFLSLSSAESAEMVESLRSLPVRHFQAGKRTKAIFDELLRLHAERKPAMWRMRLRHAMIALLLEVIDGSARKIVGDRGAVIQEIARRIESRPETDFRLQDLARMAGYSLSWFKTLFKEETGVSPRQFIHRAKIDAACLRLAAGKDSISKIALDLGFPTSQYFATVFQRYMRMSPRQFRKAGTRSRGPSRRREDGQT